MGYTVQSGELILKNGLFIRRMELPDVRGRYLLKEYRPVTGDFAFFDGDGEEFSFLLNGVLYSGATGWTLLGVENADEKAGSGEGVSVALLSADEAIQIKLTYLWYPDLPFVRKSLSICNNTQSEQCLESVDVEHFAVSEYFAPTFSWVYSDYGRKKSIGSYLLFCWDCTLYAGRNWGRPLDRGGY